MFVIRLGVPEMKALWDELVTKANQGKLSKDETSLHKKWGKAAAVLGLWAWERSDHGDWAGPHPESKKKDGYDKVKPSGTGNEI